MRKLPFALFAFIGLAGCSHQLVLPSYDTTACQFSVTDERTDPAHVYAQGKGRLQMTPVPPVFESLRGAVCASRDKRKLENASFAITDFSCMWSGFFSLTFVVDMRGHLTKPDGTTTEIRAGGTLESTNSYVPEDCSTLSGKVMTDLATKIQRTLGAE